MSIETAEVDGAVVVGTAELVGVDEVLVAGAMGTTAVDGEVTVVAK